MDKRQKELLITCFLAVEGVLYGLLLFAGGQVSVISSYLSIVCCFLISLIWGRKTAPLITAGLAFTVAADFCLVLCSPIQQLWGMIFFLGAQSLYAAKLHWKQQNKPLLLLRLGLIALGEIAAILILKNKLDALAVISVCYYANLIANIITAFSQWKINKLLPMGLAAFILCDTIIGLQVAAGSYLPIPQGSWLHQILFVDFNLAWFFYLPSQVMIALSTLPKGEKQ